MNHHKEESACEINRKQEQKMKILAVFLLAAMIAIGVANPAEDNDEVCVVYNTNHTLPCRN